MSLRRGQFTLGILLFALTAIGVVLGVWRYATREARAIAEIERLGGRLIDTEDQFGPFRGVYLVGGDHALALLHNVSGVQALSVDSTDVTDAGLEHLAQITTLEDLRLYHCKVTNDGMARLARLTGLVTLGLDHTRVGDAGLAHLAGMQKLKILDLSGALVGDAGLEHLHALEALVEVHLDDTRVTDAGVKRLQKALPHLAVER